MANMSLTQLKKRIEINPKKLAGKPVVRGTRVSVEQVLRMLASGIAEDDILEEFPQLAREDIHAAVQYAAALVEDFRAYPKEYIGQISMQTA